MKLNSFKTYNRTSGEYGEIALPVMEVICPYCSGEACEECENQGKMWLVDQSRCFCRPEWEMGLHAHFAYLDHEQLRRVREYYQHRKRRA